MWFLGLRNQVSFGDLATWWAVVWNELMIWYHGTNEMSGSQWQLRLMVSVLFIHHRKTFVQSFQLIPPSVVVVVDASFKATTSRTGKINFFKQVPAQLGLWHRPLLICTIQFIHPSVFHRFTITALRPFLLGLGALCACFRQKGGCGLQRSKSESWGDFGSRLPHKQKDPGAERIGCLNGLGGWRCLFSSPWRPWRWI